MRRTNTWAHISIVVMLALVIAGCSTANAPTTASPAASASAPSSASASGSAQAPTNGQAAAASTDPAAYGLQAGKPYDGTKLNFLVCCPTAGQFAALIKRTDAEFTPMTGIQVTWDAGPYSSFQEKLLTEASAGSGTYDVVAWVDSWGEGIKQYLVPLDERIAQDQIDMSDFPPAYVQAASGVDGQIYGLPLRGHAQVLFYREDVFEQLGLEPPQTWADVVASGNVIREQTELTPLAMYYGVTGGQNLFIWLNLLWGEGGDIFDENNRPIFNNEAGLRATQQYVDLVRNDLATRSSLTFGEAEANQEFAKGRAAMFIGWSWIYEVLTNKANAAPGVADNVGVVPAPSITGGESLSYGYIWPTGILASSTKQDASWEYLKWMTSKPVERAIALDKSDPKTNNIVVVRLSNLNDPEINATSNGLHTIMAESLQTARSQPLVIEWPEVQSVLEIAINEMASGADVQATLDQAQRDVDGIMRRGGYYE